MEKKGRIILLTIIAILLIFIIIARTLIGNVLSGRVHFPEKYIGETLTMEDDQRFVVFRRLKVDGKNNGTEGFCVFKVRFKFKSLESGANKRLSAIPAPFLMGMRGFREKYWTIDEDTGYFQGIYQWESRKMSEDYPNSFIYKVMTKRAAPGTLVNEIIPDTTLSQYIEKLLVKRET